MEKKTLKLWWNESSAIQKIIIFGFIGIIGLAIALNGGNSAEKKLKECLKITGYNFSGACQMGSVTGDATITIDKDGNYASVTYSAMGSQATESGKLINLILEEGGPENTCRIVGDWQVDGNASKGTRFSFGVFAETPNTIICQISNSQFAYYDNMTLAAEDFIKVKEILKSSQQKNEASIAKPNTTIVPPAPDGNISNNGAETIENPSPAENDMLTDDLYWIKDEKEIVVKYKGYEEGDLIHFTFESNNGDEYDFSAFPTACPYIDQNNQFKTEYKDKIFKINWQSLEPKGTGENQYPYNRITNIQFAEHNSKSTLLATPFYIISTAAVQTEAEAKALAKKLQTQGKQSGYLWIPDYPSLSGTNYYSVYIGPYYSQYECEVATEEYRILNPKAYGLLVSTENKRVQINGIGKVITTRK